MLILKILDHDLHRSRRKELNPFAIVVPDNVGYSPVLVSSTRGEFIVRRKLIQGGHPCGVFEYDSDRLDEIIGKMVRAAYDLSVNEKWGNIFTKPDKAFNYIRTTSGTTALPTNCLIPSSWSDQDLITWVGDNKYISTEKKVEMYQKTCRMNRCNTEIPVFLSRPDFVGMFTSLLGGKSSILLHNVRNSMAFCTNGIP